MLKKEPELFYPKSRKDWRDWLKKNHKKEQSVQLIFFKKETNKPSMSWSDAVDEALCFGWIDSIRRTIDKQSYSQSFSKRKVKSTWSKINKNKVEQLIANGLMTKAGHEAIALAKENGSWTVLDQVEELTIPKDLLKEFKNHQGARQFFESLSKSVKKMMLTWIAMAKRPETREKRIKEIADHCGKKSRPKQFS